MFCAKCGANNPDSNQFCLNCGVSLTARAGFPPAGSPAATLPHMDAPESSGKAIASMICGFFFFIFPAAVAAIILGHLSLSEIRRAAGRLTGRGMAITGLIFGYLGILWIPFVLIIAAIAIPNLIRARTAANQAEAVAHLRTIASAAAMYSETYSNGYPPSLLAMDGSGTGSANCDHAQLIDESLAAGAKDGYMFIYSPVPDLEVQDRTLSAAAKASGCTVAGTKSFEVRAVPVSASTGTLSFFVDQTYVIRESTNGPANADSPALGESQKF